MTAKIGDFLVSSWGYDQTNVDFYKVVGVTKTGKSVKIQKWSSAVAQDDGPQVYVVPGESPATWIDWSGVDQNADYWTQQEQKVERDAPVTTKRIKDYYSGNGYAVTLDHRSAWLWTGAPAYQTGSGWGH